MALILSLAVTSCKKLIEIDPPANEIVTETVFSDSTNANAAVTGIYVNIMNSSFVTNLANGLLPAFTGMSADDLYHTRNQTEEDQFYRNEITTNPDNYINGTLWRSGYTFIYQVNACIGGLNQSLALAQSTKNRLLGECMFLRAYLYFNLINLYGEVPLITTTDFRINATLPRTAVATIYNAIEEDLLSAQTMLPENSGSARIRPGKFAAAALLARVYLYQGKWNEAEQLATSVIANTGYQLEANLNNVFLPGSKEVIWQVRPVEPGYNTPAGAQFNPTPSGRPRYGITDNLLNAMEAGDARKTSWMKSKTVSSILYTYPFKYKLRFDGAAAPSEYHVPLRLAEQYLVRAEARARQTNLGGATADVNIIRARAALPNTTALSQAEVLEAIERERRVELFAEEGHRWFDLKRTGRASTILQPVKTTNWQTTDQLYPVPFSEILLNPALVQNPGY